MNDVDKLMAIEQVKQVKARYCRSVDLQQYDDFANLFTEDASFDVGEFMLPRSPATGEAIRTTRLEIAELHKLAGDFEWPIVGRANIRKFAANVGRYSVVVSVHHVFNPEIEVQSETQASAIWPMVDFAVYGGDSPIRSFRGMGHYHETYARIGGQWYIKTEKLRRLWVDIDVVPQVY